MFTTVAPSRDPASELPSHLRAEPAQRWGCAAGVCAGPNQPLVRPSLSPFKLSPQPGCRRSEGWSTASPIEESG